MCGVSRDCIVTGILNEKAQAKSLGKHHLSFIYKFLILLTQG